jgi:hypothetical protein
MKPGTVQSPSALDLVMALLMGVHGIGKQYLGRLQLLDLWAPALMDGLERAAPGRRAEWPDLDIAFYGDIFLRPATPGTKGGDAGADPEGGLVDLSDDEIADLEDAVAEMVPDEARIAAEQAPDKSRTRIPGPVVVMAGAIERTFPGVSGMLALGNLRQVRSYLRNPALKAALDERVAAAAAGASVLIGHSLGSVVAYEYALAHPEHELDLLLTLGSPLGLRMVRKHLTDGPAYGGPWANRRDPRDPVTCAGDLRRWWPRVDDQEVGNSADAHAADQYLCRVETGEALLPFLASSAR